MRPAGETGWTRSKSGMVEEGEAWDAGVCQDAKETCALAGLVGWRWQALRCDVMRCDAAAAAECRSRTLT